MAILRGQQLETRLSGSYIISGSTQELIATVSITLTGNVTFANPSNISAGQSGILFITQDGTGSRTAAFGSYWDFSDGTAPTLSTGANQVDVIAWIARTTTNITAQFIGNFS